MDFIRRMDPFLLLSTLALAGFGIVMVYSASFPVGTERMGDPYHFLKKQAIAAGLGIALLVLAARMNYRYWQPLALPLLIASIVLLFLVFVPGLRQQIGGAYRWLKIYGFSFQPSELAKVALVIYLARSLTKKEGRMDIFTVGFLPFCVVLAILFPLVLKQPDYGTGVLFVAVVFLMLFVAGTPFRFLLGASLAAVPFLFYLAFKANYRWERIVTFLDPWKDPGGTGFQIIQSFLAFGAGKVFGAGLGDGKQKLFYLPEIHTDFIFSVIGEELGLVGVSVVIALFLVLVIRGFQSCFRAPDRFGTYLSLGITALIAIQTLLNMGVVTGLLPTKGSTLPFISYGGTSLMMNLMAVGILLNVHSQGVRSKNEGPDRRGGNGGAPLSGPGRR
ncbi:MAG: putative lipid II flippase FtsW [Syntrophaceae bacterium]|nr:putative lipid II flippase FtsW [Syntrophaceae bacterium]